MITGARRIKDLIRNRAKGDGATAQMLLRHYAMERLLERLSVSDYRDDFVIKGGMLVAARPERRDDRPACAKRDDRGALEPISGGKRLR